MGTLYKYASADRIGDILCCHTIKFSSITTFNDIIEGYPNFTNITNQARENHPIILERCRQRLERQLNRVVSLQEVSEGIESEGGDQKVLEFFRMRTSLMGAHKMFKNIGACCFSESPEILLMWGHYADGSNGFCLGFKKNSEALTMSNHGQISGPQSVIYPETKAGLQEETYLERIKSIVLTKSPDWAYEREVRCMRTLPDDQNHLIVKFDPKDVEQIVLGPRLSKDNVRKCLDLHARHFSHARLGFACPSPGFNQMLIHEDLLGDAVASGWDINVSGFSPFPPP